MTGFYHNLPGGRQFYLEDLDQRIRKITWLEQYVLARNFIAGCQEGLYDTSIPDNTHSLLMDGLGVGDNYVEMCLLEEKLLLAMEGLA